MTYTVDHRYVHETLSVPVDEESHTEPRHLAKLITAAPCGPASRRAARHLFAIQPLKSLSKVAGYEGEEAW